VIFASGILGGKFGRRQTGKSTWDEAKAVVAGWEAAGLWEGTPPARIEPIVTEQSEASISRAVEGFLAEHRAYSAPSTLRKYQFLMAKLTAYSAHKGYVRI
jgi:hypothetical protein